MSRLILGVFGVVAVVLVSSPLSAGEPALANDVAARVEKATAIVKGKNGHGSGFLVQPNVLVTNAHVIRDELIEDVVVRFVSETGAEKECRVQLLFEDMARDLAFLRLSESLTDRQPFPIASEFKPGASPNVFVIANPGQQVRDMALLNSVAPGKCEETLAMLSGQPMIRLNCDVAKEAAEAGRPESPRRPNGADLFRRLQRLLAGGIVVGPGNSGGPVVDPSGKVVGVLTACVMSQVQLNGEAVQVVDGQFFCIPANVVTSALDRLGPPMGWDDRIRKATAQHYLNVAMSNAYVQARLAEAFLSARVEVSRRAGHAPAFQNFDKQVIGIYQEMDKEQRAKGAAALRNARGNRELTPVERKALQDSIDALEPLRYMAQGFRFDASDYKRALANVEKCRTRFKTHCDGHGVSMESVDDRLKEILPKIEIRDDR